MIRNLYFHILYPYTQTAPAVKAYIHRRDSNCFKRSLLLQCIFNLAYTSVSTAANVLFCFIKENRFGNFRKFRFIIDMNSCVHMCWLYTFTFSVGQRVGYWDSTLQHIYVRRIAINKCAKLKSNRNSTIGQYTSIIELCMGGCLLY